MAEQQKQNSPNKDVAAQGHPPSQISPFIKIFASALYSGYSPVASGTVGSFVGLLLYSIPSFEQPLFLASACVVIFVLGSLAADKMEQYYGHDPSTVTIDEVLGMWVSLLFLPKTLFIMIAAFFLFRAFDVFKPWPARVFDKMRGGWNIMLDDVVAGIYANLVIQLVLRFL